MLSTSHIQKVKTALDHHRRRRDVSALQRWWFYFENKSEAISARTGSGAFLSRPWRSSSLLVWIFRDMESAPKAPEVPDQEPLSGNFGTASFMSPRRRYAGRRTGRLRTVYFSENLHRQIMPTTTAVPIFSKPENHVIIFAKTRAGKGTRVICADPASLRARQEGRSCIVIDPKGRATAQLPQEPGHSSSTSTSSTHGANWRAPTPPSGFSPRPSTLSTFSTGMIAMPSPSRKRSPPPSAHRKGEGRTVSGPKTPQAF